MMAKGIREGVEKRDPRQPEEICQRVEVDHRRVDTGP
jgi:hypothetical protein